MAGHVTTPRLYALSPQDLAATVVSIVLVLAVVALAIQEKAVPSELGTALGAAITWLFVRSAQQAERNRPTIIDETKILAYPPEDSPQAHLRPIVHADPATTKEGLYAREPRNPALEPKENPPAAP